MKKATIIILVCILAAGLILVGVGLIISRGDLDGIFQKDVRTEKSVDETQTVTTLKLEIASDNVELYPSEDGLLHIDYWDSEQRPYTYSFSGGTAELKQSLGIKNWFQFGWHKSKIVKIYLPDTVTDTLSIKIASGDLDDKGCMPKATNLKLSLSSGNMSIKDAMASTVDIQMASGNINLQNITADSLNAKIASGDFELKNSIITGILDIDMASGDVDLNDTTIKTLKTDISSGKLNANRLAVESVQSRAASGNTTLYLIGNPSNYTIEIDLSSGRASIEGEGVSLSGRSDINWGNGGKSIYCKNSSGDIKIYFVD